MALDQYMQRTMLLLNDADFATFNEADILTYVNAARGQIAGEFECCRAYVTLDVDNSTQQYNFADVGLTAYSTLSGILNVRQISYAVGSGQQMLHSRPFPWFNSFVLGTAVPQAGEPSVWSQFGQGSTGSIFVNLLSGPFTLSLDVCAYPIPLVDDSTGEALPYQFTDAVPFLAAYYALLPVDAERAKLIFAEYQKFGGRGRNQATPSVLPSSFAQAPDPFIQTRLGLTQQRGP